MSHPNPALVNGVYPLATVDNPISSRRYISFDDERGAFVDITQHPRWKGVPTFQRVLVKRLDQFDLIAETLREQALVGCCYTMYAFARAFADNPDFGGRGLEERLRRLAWAGCIKFFQNPQLYGLRALGWGSYVYMCVEEMLFKDPSAHIIRPVFPTHQLSITRSLEKVDNPRAWGQMGS